MRCFKRAPVDIASRAHPCDAEQSESASRRSGRCCRVFGVGQVALDHRGQYPRRWRLEALTDNVRSATETKASKGKEIRILGTDHPIPIFPLRGRVLRMWVDHGDCYSVNLPDLKLAVGPRWSPVDLVATPPANLLSMHRVPWRSGT